MTATLNDILAYRRTAQAIQDGLRPAIKAPRSDLAVALRAKRDAERAEVAAPVPHSFQSAPQSAEPANVVAARAYIADALAQLDAMEARLDALIARNGPWKRYITGTDCDTIQLDPRVV